MRFARLHKASMTLAMGIAVLATSAPAIADDPYDRTMTPEAIARDREEIRRLNRNQLKYVQKRDAEYAKGWRAYEDQNGRQNNSNRSSYEASQSDYARQRQQYERDMQQWRRDVAACRSGNYAYCAR